MVRVEKTYEPNLKNAALYDELFGVYKKLYTIPPKTGWK
jgi:hypothetical protein